MNNIDMLGMLAGTISAIVFLPQVVKTYRSKSAKDISVWMFSFATISVILWLIYGILIKNGPVIYTNTCVLILSVIMLILKLKYDK
jgi:MtN3 and saliva related transmembrane protein